MAVFDEHQNVIMGAAGAGGYSVDNSMLLDDGSSQYLNRTPTVNGNGDNFTISFWVKRGIIDSARQWLFISQVGGAGVNYFAAFFVENGGTSNAPEDTLVIRNIEGSSQVYTSRVFRDPHAWYHIVIAVDTSLSESNIIKLWVNGEAETLNQDSGAGGWPTVGDAFKWNQTEPHTIGSSTGGSQGFDGYVSEFVNVDGQTLTPTSFGEYDTNGVWRPVDVSGLTFGTNGFYLDFAASGDLGNDVSGNANDFATSGSPTQSSDTPTNIHCVVTPLYLDDGALSEGNLTITPSGPNGASFGSIVIPETGVWGAKVTNINGCTSTALRVGVCSIDADKTANLSTTSGIYGVFYRDNGVVLIDGSSDTTGLDTFAASSEAVEIIVDRANDLVHFYTDGGDQGEYTIPSGHEGKPLVFATNWGATDANVTWDFGQGGYDPSGTHSGALALNSANLYTNAAPAIEDGTAHFQGTLYEGNGTSIEVNQSGNSTFQPDFAWIKNRVNGGGYRHELFDAVRGVQKYLQSSSSDAEGTDSTTLTSFDSDGYSYGSGIWGNSSGEATIAWQWKGDGTSGATNNDGSITSTVNVNDTAGFSVVKYTSTNGGGAGTVGHGQTGALDLILVKNLDSTDNWAVYHSGNTSAPETDYLILNLTNATADSNTFWNDTAPTSTVFSVGTSGAVNDQGAATNHIAYCFRSIPGYSAFGSYTGNTSADGPVIMLDFTPAYVVVKRTSSTGDWISKTRIIDPENPLNPRLYLNSANAESSSDYLIDILSNGFKVRDSQVAINGGTLIYAAFAENPFAGSSPATAR